MTVRVVVADDHPVVRSGIAALLDLEPDLTVVGEAADGEAAVALAHRLRPDLVLMDLRMPGTDAAVGRELFIAEATVKTHLLRAFAKLGVDDRTRAVTVAIERGILPAP